jgi:hypothetical protein
MATNEREDTDMATTWIKLATVPSESSPAKTYSIALNSKTGVLGCSCKAWVFGKGKACKHLVKHAEEFATVAQGALVAVGA